MHLFYPTLFYLYDKPNPDMSQLPSAEAVRALLQQRKSTFPALYTDAPIGTAVIEDMLENANWAPNHKKTEPWRFKGYQGEGRQALGEALSTVYKQVVPEDSFSERKFNKLLNNPQRSGAVIVICMQRDPNESLPEWEEVAAVSMAVQNLWLTATAHGLAGYWSSPGIIKHLGDFLGLAEGERCLGLFYLAHPVADAPDVPRERKSIADKVEWIG